MPRMPLANGGGVAAFEAPWGGRLRDDVTTVAQLRRRRRGVFSGYKRHRPSRAARRKGQSVLLLANV